MHVLDRSIFSYSIDRALSLREVLRNNSKKISPKIASNKYSIPKQSDEQSIHITKRDVVVVFISCRVGE